MQKRILIVGDSQAAGPVGQQLARAFEAAGAVVERAGIEGHGAADWVRLHWQQYSKMLLATAPTDVILLFGANDPADAALESAMQRFKQSTNAAVWYAGPPQYPTRPELQTRSAAIRELASRVFGRRHLDAWPFSGPEVSRTPDGAHFTPTGAVIWAHGILKAWHGSGASLVLGVAGAFVALLGGWFLWQRR